MTLAMDLANGGNGEFWFDKSYWRFRYGVRYTKLDWREPLGQIADIDYWGTPVTDPFVYHSHHPYCRIRSAQLKNMNIVIVLRSIFDSMESKFFKLAQIRDNPDEADDQAFAWKKLTLDAIEFYNSWGDVIRWHPRCLVFRYEDLVADPVSTHKQIADHWRLAIPEDCLREAFSRITKAKMREKLDAVGLSSDGRVSFRGDDAEIPAHRKELVRQLLKKKLVFDFGYNFLGDGARKKFQ